MRRTVLFVLMITLLSLCGCGGSGADEELVNIIMQETAAAETITACAVIETESENCKLLCVSAGDGSEIEVLEPEEISGVTAVVTGEELEIGYDGVILDAGSLSPEGLNPVSALPCAVSALRSGRLVSCWREEQAGTECVAARFQISDATLLTVWLEPELRAPVYAELDSGGKVVLSITFEQWVKG